MDVLEWSRHYRCFPGQGDFDLARYRAGRQSGYRGPLSLEIFNDGFRAAPTAVTAADGYRSLLFLEEQTRALMGHAAPSKLTALSPPALPQHLSSQFLEFAVDPISRASRRLARQTALSPSGPTSVEGCHAVPARRGLDRAERRAGFVRQRVFPAAWVVAVRVGVSRRRCPACVRARRRLRIRAVFGTYRPDERVLPAVQALRTAALTISSTKRRVSPPCSKPISC